MKPYITQYNLILFKGKMTKNKEIETLGNAQKKGRHKGKAEYTVADTASCTC
jgi:hypothetical protein